MGASPPGALARSRARELMFDYLAVARRGMASPAGVAARGLASGGDARIEGTADRAAATTAALVNGIAAHSIELDDTYEPASLHPGVVVWPAIFALADQHGATLGHALDAAIAAYNFTAALGDRLDPATAYARGFHPTGVCGSIGAAVAAAHMLRLDPARQAHAVGIAASASSGLLEFLTDGAWTKPFHAGNAASAGIVSAQLAGAGFTGPATAIEGRHGFLHAFGGRGDITAPLAEPAVGHGVLGTAMKLYPCCRYTHGNLDLILDEDLEASDVASLSCGVLAAGWGLVAEPRRIAGAVDAQFSMSFTAALALSRGDVTLDAFTAAADLADELAPLMDRIECHRSEPLEAAFPAAWGSEIVVQTKGGATLRRHATHMRGAPARPLARDALLGKAARLIGADDAARLLAACMDTPEDAPVSRLGR